MLKCHEFSSCFPLFFPPGQSFPLLSVHFQAGRGPYLVLDTHVTHLHSIIHTCLLLRRSAHSFIFSRCLGNSQQYQPGSFELITFWFFFSLLYLSSSFVCSVPAPTPVLACLAQPASNFAVDLSTLRIAHTANLQ